MEKTYAYHVVAYYDDCEITTSVNKVENAIGAVFEHAEQGADVRLLDGYTGEIYVMVGENQDTYMADGWDMTILGWMMTHL